MDSISLEPLFNAAEMEMMKERFAKLLLGEDMSGSGQGVCPALAISNAITNLCGKDFYPLAFCQVFCFNWYQEVETCLHILVRLVLAFVLAIGS